MSAPTAARGGQPLDEIMLAMDVVDTLRHRQHLVAQELEGSARDHALIERLRQIYTAQGIEVGDRVLQEGVAALREDRFAFRPPPDTPLVRLARLYVQRGLWARRLLVAALVVVAAYGAYRAAIVAPREALAGQIEASHAAITGIARDADAGAQADALRSQAEAAIAAGDSRAAREAAEALVELQADLASAFVLQIVVGRDAVSGVWRVPDLNVAARNYYLIVEAIDERGRRVRLPIRNEETGEIERVSTFGLRVDEATFERVAADKLDDGIIRDRLVGVKRAGELRPEYTVPTTGGAITRW